MNENDIKSYLEKLKELDSQLNSDDVDDDDLNLYNEINDLLKQLSDDITTNSEISTSQSYNLKIKVKKLHPNAVIPSYSKDGDAGMDLTAVSKEMTDDYISYKIGLAFEIPKGYVGLLFPRSSNSKKDLFLTNSVGVLDSGYRGEVEFRYKLINQKSEKTYNVGDRVGQIMVLPYPQIEFIESDTLSDSQRGNGGFGSTGN